MFAISVTVFQVFFLRLTRLVVLMVNPAAVQDKKKEEKSKKEKRKEEKKNISEKKRKKKEVGLTLLVGLLRAIYSQALSHY